MPEDSKNSMILLPGRKMNRHKIVTSLDFLLSTVVEIVCDTNTEEKIWIRERNQKLEAKTFYLLLNEIKK